MTAIATVISIILLNLLISSADSYELIETNNQLTNNFSSGDIIKNPWAKAFKILDNKCNVCHHKRNKGSVFTSGNMNGWSNDIYKLVLMKMRMPKGNKIKLNTDEYQALLTWISSIKNNQNGNQL